MPDILIKCKDLCLEIPLYDQSKRLFSKSKIKDFSNNLIGSQKIEKSNKIVSKILDNINLELYEGDTLGLLGHNGCGKTTLLRVLAGIYTPTSGLAEVNGSVNSIFNIGSILNPDATGYENIKIVKLYFTNENDNKNDNELTKELISSVEEYSDLGDFLNIPVKVYSAGMQTRLIFAITMCLNSEISLIDEGIATGDENFRIKATQMIKDYYSKKKLRLFASHDFNFLKDNCNKIYIMKKGIGKLFNDVDDAIKFYISEEYQSL